jgi:hypothetical protein
MKRRLIVFAVVLSLEVLPAYALELKNPENHEPRLNLEIEVLPAPQRDFEQYVQELAASARRDANEAKSHRDDESRNEQPLKTLNPLVLFRW